MTISEGRLVLRDRGPEEMINNARGILLFGCGDDGVKTAEAIHGNGGTAIDAVPLQIYEAK